MRFDKFYIKDGLQSSEYNFTPGINHIHSSENKTGKTTLIRALLYMSGFNLHATGMLNFNTMSADVEIISEDSSTIKLVRDGQKGSIGNDRYVFPNDILRVHSKMFGVNGQFILDNLLGAFYIDQDIGWNLINYGEAVPGIHFSLKDLLMGLSGNNCEQLKRRNELSKKMKWCKSFLQFVDRRKVLSAQENSFVFDSDLFDDERKCFSIETRLMDLNKEIAEIDSLINQNNHLPDMLASMKILVKLDDGSVIPLTKERLDGFSDNVNYLRTRKDELIKSKAKLSKQLSKLKEELSDRRNLEDINRAISKSVNDSGINTLHIMELHNKLGAEKKKIDNNIAQTNAKYDEVVSKYTEIIKDYFNRFNIADLFKDDDYNALIKQRAAWSKKLSGCVQLQASFASRLACITTIREYTGAVLPIIFDSPGSKEATPTIIAQMVDVIRKDFKEHQAIIASIHEIPGDDVNRIEMNRLFPSNTLDGKRKR